MAQARRVRADGQLDRRFANQRHLLDNQHVHGADEMQAKLNAIAQYIGEDMPHIVGIESVKFFKKSFEKESWNGDKWESRKTKRPGGTNNQKILSKSGELKDSIDYRVEGDKAVFFSDKDYAELHNEGGEIVVTDAMRRYFWAMYYNAKEGGDVEMADQYKGMALAKKITMPKRQFMGESPALTEAITARVNKDLNAIVEG